MLGFLLGLVSLGTTAIELLAGYRGWPQMVSLALAALLFALLALFMAWLAAGGAGT